jgi:hypothetical protein
VLLVLVLELVLSVLLLEHLAVLSAVSSVYQLLVPWVYFHVS